MNRLFKSAFLSRRLNINSFSQFKINRFSSSNTDKDNKAELIIGKNPKENSELLIQVPSEYQTVYSFGTISRLPLYENYESFKNFSVFLPLHKGNILIFGVYTALCYGSLAFQPSLLATLYAVQKLFLNNNLKVSEVLSIHLLPDLFTIHVKTFFTNFILDIADTSVGSVYRVGGSKYYELKNPTLKNSLYVKDNGKFLNKSLFEELLNGEYEKVRITTI